MLELLTPRVWADITAAAKGATQPSQAAVAYFGHTADRLLPLCPGSDLVVDASIRTVAGGGTCPAALARLQSKGVSIYSAKDLHAKIFAFDELAFVGSANASMHSEKTLIEAVVKFGNKVAIVAVRNAVSGLCLNRLSAADLARLSKYYKIPRIKPEPTRQLNYSTLLMDLTVEQGKGRETQVQPPKTVWTHYFRIDVAHSPLPKLKLTDEDADVIVESVQNIVKHDHNYTIEITGAGAKRPAILQMRKTGKDRYRYRVLRPGDKEYVGARHLLTTMSNPLWTSGRRWLVI